MARKIQLRTCTIMVMTDGTNSTYGVFQGPMKGKCFNSHKADMITSYTVIGKPDYVAMTAKHATIDAPAVDWQV